MYNIYSCSVPSCAITFIFICSSSLVLVIGNVNLPVALIDVPIISIVAFGSWSFIYTSKLLSVDFTLEIYSFPGSAVALYVLPSEDVTTIVSIFTLSGNALIINLYSLDVPSSAVTVIYVTIDLPVISTVLYVLDFSAVYVLIATYDVSFLANAPTVTLLVLTSNVYSYVSLAVLLKLASFSTPPTLTVTFCKSLSLFLLWILKIYSCSLEFCDLTVILIIVGLLVISTFLLVVFCSYSSSLTLTCASS